MGRKGEPFYRAAVAMQPARTNTANGASRAMAQSVVIMIGSFRSGRDAGWAMCSQLSLSAVPHPPISMVPSWQHPLTLPLRVSYGFCRLSAGLGEKDVGVEILP